MVRSVPVRLYFSTYIKEMLQGRVEIGEGRSKSIYIEPTVKDTAVMLAFYNPAKFKRLLRNILYVIKSLKDKNIPYFVIECVFNGAAPEIPDATMVVKSNSYMFYKEQLNNKLETVIPEQYTKLVCMDGDIMFDTPDWLDQVSLALDNYDIIQPFSEACWLVPDNTRIRSKKPSYAVGLTRNVINSDASINMFHPGFAWAFKRDTFRKLGGFFPRAIVGNGDSLFAFNFLKDGIPQYWMDNVLNTDNRIILDAWPPYNENFKKVNPKLGFINNKALHLFHGVTQNRQYRTRYKTMSPLFKGKWDDQININSDGLFEFKLPEINASNLKYFKGRNEDIPLEEAERISRTSYPTRRRRRFRRKRSMKN